MLKVLGVPVQTERLERAIRFSAFDTLRAQEDASGFIEHSGAKAKFFRAGKMGAGRATLSDHQIAIISGANRKVMGRFGYLP